MPLFTVYMGVFCLLFCSHQSRSANTERNKTMTKREELINRLMEAVEKLCEDDEMLFKLYAYAERMEEVHKRKEALRQALEEGKMKRDE